VATIIAERVMLEHRLHNVGRGPDDVDLPRTDRAGSAHRHGRVLRGGGGTDRDRDEALDEMLLITRSGLVWALCLGSTLAQDRRRPSASTAAVDLLQAMDPDPDVVAAHWAWARVQLARYGDI
jgi:hypothetical protein